jgi:hypothetical protein
MAMYLAGDLRFTLCGLGSPPSALTLSYVLDRLGAVPSPVQSCMAGATQGNQVLHRVMRAIPVAMVYMDRSRIARFVFAAVRAAVIVALKHRFAQATKATLAMLACPACPSGGLRLVLRLRRAIAFGVAFSILRPALAHREREAIVAVGPVEMPDEGLATPLAGQRAGILGKHLRTPLASLEGAAPGGVTSTAPASHCLNYSMGTPQ